MTAFTPSEARTIEAKYGDGELDWVKLWVEGSLHNKFVSVEDTTVSIGRTIFRHPEPEKVDNGTTSGGFLRMMLNIDRDSNTVRVENLRGPNIEKVEFERLQDDLNLGKVVRVDPRLS